MKDIFFVFAVLAIWFGLSRWVLPWLGIPTCMSGNCRSACCSSWNSDAPSCDAAPQQGETQTDVKNDEK
jgi:hypothetical protein